MTTVLEGPMEEQGKEGEEDAWNRTELKRRWYQGPVFGQATLRW